MPDYLVKRSGTKKFTVTQEKTVVAENLSELADVSVSNLPGSDKFVLAYNATSAKFELIPADTVLTVEFFPFSPIDSVADPAVPFACIFILVEAVALTPV